MRFTMRKWAELRRCLLLCLLLLLTSSYGTLTGDFMRRLPCNHEFHKCVAARTIALEWIGFLLHRSQSLIMQLLRNRPPSMHLQGVH